MIAVAVQLRQQFMTFARIAGIVMPRKEVTGKTALKQSGAISPESSLLAGVAPRYGYPMCTENCNRYGHVQGDVNILNDRRG